MKKLLMIAALMVAAVSVHAQNVEEGFYVMPKVGINMAEIIGADDTKGRAGLLTVGAEAGYTIENLGITGAVMYSQQGAKYKNGGGKIELDYIIVPILGEYYLLKGFAVKAGLQPGFLLKSKSGGVDVKKGCNKFDLSVPIGLSYEYKNIVLDARYNIGCTKIIKKDYTDDTFKNGVLQITLGYKFQL